LFKGITGSSEFKQALRNKFKIIIAKVYHICVFGSGKSSVYLLYLLQENTCVEGFKLTIIDPKWQQLPKKCKQDSKATFLSLDLLKDSEKIALVVKNQDLVVSLLPPSLHAVLARICLKYTTHFLSASYVSSQMQELHTEAKNKRLLFLNEMGLDPGLDHISVLEWIDRLKSQKAQILALSSHTGGLIAAPTGKYWDYKFTWNSRNVIEAGKSGGVFLKDFKSCYLPYEQLFAKSTPLQIQDQDFETYANRDSIPYLEKYKLQSISYLYRGTLRHPDFCKAWNELIALGLTDTNKVLHFSVQSTTYDFLSYFLERNPVKARAFQEKYCQNFFGLKDKCAQIGFTSTSAMTLPLLKGTAADILHEILKIAWKLTPEDRDLVVMRHDISFEIHQKKYRATRMLRVFGEDVYFTAMSKTVGIPLYLAILAFKNGKYKGFYGVHIPNSSPLYLPIWKYLPNYGIDFIDELSDSI